MTTWWLLAVRGALGVLLGLVLLVSPGIGLGGVVALFGLYAILDGIWAVAWAARAARRLVEGWPVVVEGVVAVALGIAALGFPIESAAFARVIAGWGVLTGLLQILVATRLPRGVTAHWALIAAGAWSIFLAVLVLGLPHAATESLVRVIGVYALVFGTLVSTAALRSRHVAAPVVARSAEHTWTAR